METVPLLAKILKNTEPKMSFFIKDTIYKTRFNPLIQLDETKKYEMALVNLETYFSFPNVNKDNNNFRYSPDNGVTWFNINIPEGRYEITDINSYVQRIMKENGHYDTFKDESYITIGANHNTLKSILNIRSTYKVDLATSN